MCLKTNAKWEDRAYTIAFTILIFGIFYQVFYSPLESRQLLAERILSLQETEQRVQMIADQAVRRIEAAGHKHDDLGFTPD